MVLRVRLSDVDIARIRLVQRADPLWEVRRSLLDINRGVAPTPLANLHPASAALRPFRMLLTIAPASGDAPDFRNPVDGCADIREGIERIVDTSQETLLRDLAWFVRIQRLPDRPCPVTDSDRVALRFLSQTVRQYFEAIIAPHWRSIQHAVHSDVDIRLAALTNGVESLLASMGPAITWERPYLIVKHVTETELDPGGRGLILQPVFFGQDEVSLVSRPDNVPLLAYPIRRSSQRPSRCASAADAPLDSLLGRTRSAALALLSIHQCTTTELAAKLGISLPSASQHAKVLREAGLIITSPQGKAVLHSASILGSRLAQGQL